MSFNKVTIWIMWLTVSFFYAFQYILRVIPSIMITDIMNRFDIDAAVFGQFSGVYYLGYSLMHIPLGLLLDRFGPKKILPIFISLTIVGTLPLVISNFWVYPILGRFLVGMGSSSAILGVFKIVRMAFGERRFALMLSWSVTIGLLGAIYGGGPLNYIKEQVGYSLALWMLMGLGLLLALSAYFLLPEQLEEKEAFSVWQSIKSVLSNKRALATCIFAGFMVGPLEGFADVWGATFLQTSFGLDKNVASSLPSFLFIGMAVGGPVLSFLAAKINNYLAVIFASGVLMAAGFVLLLTTSLPASALMALFFAIGMLCGYQMLAIYLASTYVPAKMAGLMTAAANMIIMTFGYLFHTGIGFIVDVFSGHGGYTPLDSGLALHYGIAIIPVGLAIGSLGYALMMKSSKKA